MARSSQRNSILIIAFLAICGFLGMLFAQKNSVTVRDSDSDVSDSLKQFTEVYNIVEQNYAEPVNPDKAIYNGAIPGMLHVLDPHSNFFDPNRISFFRKDNLARNTAEGWPVGPRNKRATGMA